MLRRGREAVQGPARSAPAGSAVPTPGGAGPSVITSSIAVATQSVKGPGFRPGSRKVDINLDYDFLCDLYSATRGMVADKIKGLLSITWEQLTKQACRGVIFAYDEA